MKIPSNENEFYHNFIILCVIAAMAEPEMKNKKVSHACKLLKVRVKDKSLKSYLHKIGKARNSAKIVLTAYDDLNNMKQPLANNLVR